MELLSWLLSGAAALVTFVLFFKGFRFRTRLNRPPGPKPWPIIGNLNLISSLPHLSIHDLSQKYGPIMQLQFGSFPVVVGSSVEMAEQFLKVHDLNFSSRPKSSAGKYTAYDHNDMLWAPYGVYWRYARKIFFLELFSMKRLDSYEYIRAEELRLFLNDLYTSCGNPITLRHNIWSLTLNNITRMILGKKYLGGESDVLKKILDEWLLLNGVLNIGDLIPWINFLDLQGYVKRMKALRNKIDHFLEHALEEHIAKRQDHLWEFLPKDMLEVLLQLSADNPKPELKLSRNQVKGLTLGARIIVNTWSIGRDPTLWDAPNEFRPERFMGRAIDVKGQKFELFPFGSGRRMCPGYNLGLKFVESGLANLLHGFTWELPNQMKPRDLNMEEVFGLSVPKKVLLVVVAEPRLPHSFYSTV